MLGPCGSLLALSLAPPLAPPFFLPLFLVFLARAFSAFASILSSNIAELLGPLPLPSLRGVTGGEVGVALLSNGIFLEGALALKRGILLEATGLLGIIGPR